MLFIIKKCLKCRSALLYVGCFIHVGCWMFRADVLVAELLARYLRAMDGDCDSEPVDFWFRNNYQYYIIFVSASFSHRAAVYGVSFRDSFCADGLLWLRLTVANHCS